MVEEAVTNRWERVLVLTDQINAHNTYKRSVAQRELEALAAIDPSLRPLVCSCGGLAALLLGFSGMALLIDMSVTQHFHLSRGN